MKVLAYRAYSARKLAKLTMAKKDERLATKLENELLTALKGEEVPTPETQEGNAQYAEWLKEMEGRF